MLQPPILDKCRALGAAAVYVEANGTHILNSAYGHPSSEILNPSALCCFPMQDASGTGGEKPQQTGLDGLATYTGTHSSITDSPAADPGWVDPITKCTGLTNGARMSGTIDYDGGAFVAGKGLAVSFWYKHPAGGTNTQHTALHFQTTKLIGGGNNFVGVDINVVFANDNSCRRPSVTITNGTDSATLVPDQDRNPWEVYGQDNDWHHILFSTRGSHQKLYIDGLLSSTATISNFGFDQTDTAALCIGSNSDGSDGIGASGSILFSHPTVHRIAPPAQDVARIVASFTRPLDMVRDGTIEVGPTNKVSDGPISRCDHGYYSVLDNKQSSTNPRNFRETGWKQLERPLLGILTTYYQSTFFTFRLFYDQAGGAGGQGNGKFHNLERTGYSEWDICGGTHTASFDTNTPDGYYFERYNRGWRVKTSYKNPNDSGSAIQNRTFEQDNIYPATVEQDYDTVKLEHTMSDSTTSRLTIRTGKSDLHQEANTSTIRDAASITNEKSGGWGMTMDSVDKSRYGIVALFRSNISDEDYDSLRRLSLGQAQIRSRPGLRTANRNYTQTAPSRGQGFIE